MKKILLLILLLSLGATAVAQNNEATIDSGKLLIFSEGKQAGTEQFNIKGKWVGESSSTLTLGGKTGDFKSRTEYQDRHPLSFSMDFGPNMKMQVAFNGTEARLISPAQQTQQTDPEAIILGNNIWHQYHFLIQRYDRQKGGVQQFKMFAPSIMQTLALTLESKGVINPLPDKSVKLEQYRASMASSVSVDIITDSGGRLVYISEPFQKSDAVREEYAASIESLRAAATSAAAKSAEIDYSAPPNAPFTAEEVTVNAKGFTLAGTLLLPKQGTRPFPAVITITGSGQQTRDEPVPFPGLEKYGLMRQIAETLASRGIAVLRVDDRGVGKSKGFDTLMNVTTSDFAADVRAQIAYLRSRPEIDAKRIALVGHSEGGIIAPMVAAVDSQVAAIVLMAGTAKRGDRVVVEQLNDMLARDAKIPEEEKNKQRVQQQELIRAITTGGDTSKFPSVKAVAWLKEFFTYNPLPTIGKVRQPILILQGELDRQVTAEQAGMLEQAARAAGNKDVTVRLFPTLNHLFLPSKTGAFSEYSTLETSTVPDDVLKTLGDWLETKLKAKSGK